MKSTQIKQIFPNALSINGVASLATVRAAKELPDNKLISEQEMNYDVRNGHLVEIDLSGDDGLVEVHRGSE